MINKFLIGWYHAKYHRNLKKAENAQKLKGLENIRHNRIDICQLQLRPILYQSLIGLQKLS